MRMLALLLAALSVIALTACAAADNDAHRGQSGPYISGSAGVGFK